MFADYASSGSVLVVDDDRAFARFVATIFERVRTTQVEHDLASARAAIKREPAIALAVVDLALSPGPIVDDRDPEGFSLIRLLQECHPLARVVALSGFHNARLVNWVHIHGGAYLIKSPEVVHNLLNLADKLAHPRNVADIVLAFAEWHDLTERQTEILQLIAQEATNRQVAEELGITSGSVARHMNRILVKTGCATRRELRRRALAQLAPRPVVPRSPSSDG